jgi:hypothetical protein
MPLRRLAGQISAPDAKSAAVVAGCPGRRWQQRTHVRIPAPVTVEHQGNAAIGEQRHDAYNAHDVSAGERAVYSVPDRVPCHLQTEQAPL